MGIMSVIVEVVATGEVSANAAYYDKVTGEPTGLHSLTVSRGFGGSIDDILINSNITAYNVQLLDIMGRLVSTNPSLSVSELRAGIYILRADSKTIKLRVQ